jgi:hypothetical protein
MLMQGEVYGVSLNVIDRWQALSRKHHERLGRRYTCRRRQLGFTLRRDSSSGPPTHLRPGGGYMTASRPLSKASQRDSQRPLLMDNTQQPHTNCLVPRSMQDFKRTEPSKRSRIASDMTLAGSKSRPHRHLTVRTSPDTGTTRTGHHTEGRFSASTRRVGAKEGDHVEVGPSA